MADSNPDHEETDVDATSNDPALKTHLIVRTGDNKTAELAK
jgi:hypothetical protein